MWAVPFFHDLILFFMIENTYISNSRAVHCQCTRYVPSKKAGSLADGRWSLAGQLPLALMDQTPPVTRHWVTTGVNQPQGSHQCWGGPRTYIKQVSPPEDCQLKKCYGPSPPSSTWTSRQKHHLQDPQEEDLSGVLVGPRQVRPSKWACLWAYLPLANLAGGLLQIIQLEEERCNVSFRAVAAATNAS